MYNLNSHNSFIRIFRFGFISAIKLMKMYLFMLIVPVVVYVFAYLYSNDFDQKMLSPAIMLSKLVLPSIFAIFFISSFVCDWNNSIFSKSLHVFKLNKFKYFCALFLLFMLFDVFFTLIFFAFTLVIDVFLTNQSMLNAIKLETYQQIIQEQQITPIVNFRRIIGIIFTFLLSFTLNFLIAFLTTSIIKQAIFIQIVNLCLVLLILFMSDLIIDPNNATYNNATLYLGYFMPQKYITWLTFLFYIDIQSNHDYLNLVIINLFSKMFVENYSLPMIMSGIFITILSVIHLDFRYIWKEVLHEKTVIIN